MAGAPWSWVALLGVGDKPGVVVEVANDLWDSSRLAERAAACRSQNVIADRPSLPGLKARCAIVRGVM